MTATVARPQGWYYGWNIVGLGVLSQMFSIGLPINCFSLFLSGWHKEFGVPVSTLALAVTIFSLACAGVIALVGWAADKYPARWLMGGGLVLVALFHAAVGFAAAGWQIAVLYFLASAPITMAATVSAQALVSRWFVRRRGLALGLSAFGLAAAGVAFPPLVVLILKTLGWRETWWLFAAFIALVIFPLFFFAVRDRPRPDDPFGYVTGRGTSAAPGLAPALTLKTVLSRRNFWVTGVVFVCVYCVNQGVVINLAPLVMSHGLSLVAAGYILAGLHGADLAAKLGVGALTDRIGNRLPLIGVSLAAALATGLLAFAHGSLAVILALMLVGVAGSAWTLLASATAAEFGQSGFGRAYGLISTFSPLGALAPPLLARTQETTGSYEAGLLALAALALVGAGVGFFFKEGGRAQQAA